MTTTANTAADQWPTDYEPTLEPNLALERPALRLCVDLYLETSLPWTLPVDLSTPPLRIATDEFTVPFINTHYTCRVLGVPTFESSAPDLFGAVPTLQSITLDVSLTDPDDPRPWSDLRPLIDGWEARGKLVICHWYDTLAQTFTPEVFVGYIGAIAGDLHTLQLVLVADEPGRLADPLPPATVTTRHFPAATVTGPTLPWVFGCVERVPLRRTRERIEADTEIRRTFTADDTTDELTIAAHGLGDGDGPFRVDSTGTLPDGLDDRTDYWVTATTTNTLQLTRDPAGDVLVDLLDAGTGTHTLTDGVPSQPDDEWDYTAWGTLQVDAVYSDGEPTLPGEVTIRRRDTKIAGRYCTSVRFRDDAGSVTADVQAIHPDITETTIAAWDFAQGFDDMLGRWPLTPSGGLTTGSLRTGPSGIGLGAVTLDGTDDALETAAGLPLPQRFTIAAWYWWDGAADGVVINGPGSLDDGSDYPSWFLHVTAAGAVDFRYRAGVGLGHLVSAAGPLRARRWSLLGVTVDASDVTVLVDRVPVATAAKSAPIAYGPTTRGVVIGAPLDVGFGYLGGPLGAVWLDGRVWTQRDWDRAWWRMRRNPIEAAREIEAVSGGSVHAVRADLATEAVDAVEDGALKCDGCVDTPATLTALRQQISPFREVRYGRTGTGQVTIDVPDPLPPIRATFGLGDDIARNILSVDSIAPASLAEVVRDLPVAFRPVRDATTGALTGGFTHTITRRVHAVGRAADPLPLLLVRDRTTGDIIADFRAKRGKTRNILTRISVGYEGRDRQPGDVVRIRMPGLGIDLRDYALLQVAQGQRSAGFGAVPHRSGDHDYTPKRLPDDPPTPTLRVLDLGNATTLTATRVTDQVTLTVTPRDLSTVLPVGPSSLMQGTLTGGATHAAVLSDGSDSTYVEHPSAGSTFVAMAVPTLSSRGIGFRVTVRLRAREITAGVAYLGLRLAGVTAFSGPNFLTTSVAAYEYTWITSPFTGVAWTLAEINALEAGGTFSNARCMEVALDVSAVLDPSDKLGAVRYSRQGPTPSDPGLPAEFANMIAQKSSVELPFTLVDTIDDTSGNTYWYGADVYNKRNQLVLRLGTTEVAVP